MNGGQLHFLPNPSNLHKYLHKYPRRVHSGSIDYDKSKTPTIPFTMGVEGVFPFLETMEVETRPVDMSLVKRVEVDVMSLFFSYIRTTHKWMTFAAFKKTTLSVTQEISDEAILSRLVAKVHSKLLECFIPCPDTILHIDGMTTAQKARAREIRTARNLKDEADLQQSYQEIQGFFRVSCASTDEPISRKAKRRLLRLYRKSRDCWAATRKIDSSTKKFLLEGLKELGWEVCPCPGEADVCIGRKADEHPGQVTAASTDSDLLFHGLKSLLRKDFKSRSFNEYRVKDILQKLDISEQQWIVAGLVTNNDYSSHIRGQSFAKNIAAVRDCSGDGAKDVLNQYCERYSVESERYRYSKDIFFEHYETVEEVITSNKVNDDIFKTLVKEFSKRFKE